MPQVTIPLTSLFIIVAQRRRALLGGSEQDYGFGSGEAAAVDGTVDDDFSVTYVSDDVFPSRGDLPDGIKWPDNQGDDSDSTSGSTNVSYKFNYVSR